MPEQFIDITGERVLVYPLSNHGLVCARENTTNPRAALYTLFVCNRQRHLERGKHLSGNGFAVIEHEAQTIALEALPLVDTDLPGYRQANGALLNLLEHWGHQDAFIATVRKIQSRRTLTYGDPRASDVDEIINQQRQTALLPATIAHLTGGILLELDANGQLELTTHT